MLYKFLRNGAYKNFYFKKGEVKQVPDELAKELVAALGEKRIVQVKGGVVAAPVEGSGGEKPLDKMNKTELVAKAKEMGFSDELIGSLDKAGLIATIQEEQAADAAKQE